MKVLKYLLEKEFRQIFRNKSILRIIFLMPIVQLIVLPWAADYEMKNIIITVIDHDHSPVSRQLISNITASGYFILQDYNNSYKSSLGDIESDKADLILEIPNSFAENLTRKNEANLFIAVNAINGVKAGLGGTYLQTIIQNYNADIRTKYIQPSRFSPEKNIDVISSNWYNPQMNYKNFMVPGILVILVTLVGSFLASLNIVKEKEIGTIEQINVTPIKKWQFIAGKLIPFWLLGLIVLLIGLLISRLFYGIIPQGNLCVLLIFAAIYMLAVLGLGLLISTYTSTQQQAMLISFFLIMVFVLLGGLYTSIDSMPHWAQVLTKFNPVTYFVEVIRMVILKGSGFADIKNQLLIISGFAILLNGWAVFNYRKRY